MKKVRAHHTKRLALALLLALLGPEAEAEEAWGLWEAPPCEISLMPAQDSPVEESLDDLWQLNPACMDIWSYFKIAMVQGRADLGQTLMILSSDCDWGRGAEERTKRASCSLLALGADELTVFPLWRFPWPEGDRLPGGHPAGVYRPPRSPAHIPLQWA